MNRVIYSLIALTLTLSACGVGEPKKIRGVEPQTIVMAVPNEELSTFNFIYPHYSFGGEIKKKEDFYRFIASSVEAKKKKSKIQTVAKVTKPEQEKETKPKVKPKAVSTASVEASDNEPEGRKRTFTLTSYTSGVESTGKRKGDSGYGITASGARVKEGITASCPTSYELGTKIYIPSLGNTYICQDRGSAIKGNILDIYIEDLDRALEFGRKLSVVGYVLAES